MMGGYVSVIRIVHQRIVVGPVRIVSLGVVSHNVFSKLKGGGLWYAGVAPCGGFEG